MSLAAAKIVLIIMCLIGLIGTILPSIPGLLVIWVASLIFAYFTDFTLIDTQAMILLTVLAVAAQLAGYLISLVGAKLAGATRRGVFGALAGAVIGLVIAGPIGMILGSFIGAVLLELTQKDLTDALRAGVGALFGSMGGIVLEFIIGLIMLFIIIPAIY
ncbi:MAG: DUF456 domain-containing protein [Firmicutes bacterium]|nr:DUF456 domain-containing protein [Bacillota bacterium]